MITQKDAVYKTITEVFKESGVDFDAGVDSAYDLVDKQIRQDVMCSLFNQFRSGSIKLDKEYSDDKLKNYISTLINNWMKKDPRLNGGTEFHFKNPGSRIGQADPLVLELRKLLKAAKGSPQEFLIKEHIRKRQTELRKDMLSSIKIDVSILPTSLQNLVPRQ